MPDLLDYAPSITQISTVHTYNSNDLTTSAGHSGTATENTTSTSWGGDPGSSSTENGRSTTTTSTWSGTATTNTNANWTPTGGKDTVVTGSTYASNGASVTDGTTTPFSLSTSTGPSTTTVTFSGAYGGQAAFTQLHALMAAAGGTFDENLLSNVGTPAGASISGDFTDTNEGGAPADADGTSWLTTAQNVGYGFLVGGLPGAIIVGMTGADIPTINRVLVGAGAGAGAAAVTALPGALYSSLSGGPCAFFSVEAGAMLGGVISGGISGVMAKDTASAAQAGLRTGAVVGTAVSLASPFGAVGVVAETIVAGATGAATETTIQAAEINLGMRSSFDVYAIAQDGLFSSVAVLGGKLVQKFLPFCFTPETLVAAEGGPTPISSIKAGQQVWAYNLAYARWELRPVLETFELEHAGDLVRIAVGDENHREEIRSTAGHPFWVIEGEDLTSRPAGEHISDPYDGALILGRWVDAGDLRVGDLLLLKNGQAHRVTALTLEPYVGKVYNFMVDDLHCYAVGSGGVLVHNTCFAGQLAINKANGTAAENTARELLEAGGNRIIASQVPVQTPGLGLRMIDHLIQTASGDIVAIEVKFGNSTYKASQQAKDALIASSQGIFSEAIEDLAGIALTGRAILTRILRF